MGDTDEPGNEPPAEPRRRHPILTRAELEVLCALDDLINDELGYAPTYKQLLARLGWSPKSGGSLHQYLVRLRKLGLVTGAGRSLSLRSTESSRGAFRAAVLNSGSGGAPKRSRTRYLLQGTEEEVRLLPKSLISTNGLQQALRLLRRAQVILASPEHWTKHAWARDAQGRPVHPDDEHAQSFCLVGAILRADYELHGTRSRAVRRGEHGVLDLGEPRKAASSAVMLLVFPMLLMHGFLYPPKPEAEKKAEQERTEARDPAVTTEEAPGRRLLGGQTTGVAVINDVEKIEWVHVTEALAAAIALAETELRDRRQATRAKSRKSKKGSRR